MADTHTHTYVCVHVCVCVCVYKELITQSQNKNEIISLEATCIDLEIIILSEISQAERDKYHDITYM